MGTASKMLSHNNRTDRRCAAKAPVRTVMLSFTVAAILLACTGSVFAQDAVAPIVSESTDGDVAPDRYVVVLRDDPAQTSERVASEQAGRLGLEVSQTYRNAIKGYAARIPVDRLEEVRADPNVAYVEPDRIVKATEQSLPYGINLIDADLSSTKAGDGAGSVSNVNAYIIDTGIDKKRPDLNVADHVDFAGGKNRDCNGHGTHVAGIVAARDDKKAVVGVAPGAPLTGVKVLGCNGSGRVSNVIKGVDWVTQNAKKPAIANMSLGGGVSEALDAAVRTSAASGVFYTVASGNEDKDACDVSPARAGAGTDNGIMTTAATNRSDQEADFSNFGSCVDVWAPGVNILSTRLGGGTTRRTGTSFSSPHASGAGALYLSANTAATPAAVEQQLKTDSVVTGTNSRNGDRILRVNAASY